MQNPLDSIPDDAKSQLRKISEYTKDADLPNDGEIIFSHGFGLAVLEDSCEYKERVQAYTNDHEAFEEMCKYKHPCAIEVLEKNYWRYLKKGEGQISNARHCAISLEIDHIQTNVDFLKAQSYVYLEKLGITGEESLAEDMARKIINGENAEDIFTSYLQNGTIEYEEIESEMVQNQQDDEWECEYCGATFDLFEEASRHEEICEMSYDEDDGDIE